MPRRALRYGFDLLLLGTAVVAFLTGLLADRLDLHAFALHRWSGYVLALLVLVHVVAHWGFWVSVLRRRPTGPEPVPAQVAGPTRRTALVAAGAGVVGGAAGWLVRDVTTPSSYAGGDPGAFYHRASSLGLPSLVRGLVSWGARPPSYKKVAEATIALPNDRSLPELPVGQALRQRRSLRTYRDRPVTMQELAWVVDAATATTSANGYRTAPSAGALYPIETYVAANRVDGVPAGLYHVDVRRRALEPVRSGSVAGDLFVAGIGQDFLRRAPVVVVLTAVFQRTRWKYHERHYRYVVWEGGHIAQSIYLAAEAAGLGACMVGAFLDRQLNDLLRINGRQEAALGLVAVGPR